MEAQTILEYSFITPNKCKLQTKEGYGGYDVMGPFDYLLVNIFNLQSK